MDSMHPLEGPHALHSSHAFPDDRNSVTPGMIPTSLIAITVKDTI